MEKEERSEEEQTELSTKEKSIPTTKKKKFENSKRFSDEQVKSLESTFNRGTKLEPRMKLQLARDLGLQPSQVSIWFQNKRARWKSKHIEQEYRVLKANFDALYKQFESLKKEKESLLDQLQTLRSLLENQDDRHNSRKDSYEDGMDNDPRNGDRTYEFKQNNDMALCLDEDEIGVEQCFKQKEEPHIFSLSRQGGSSVAAPEQLRNLASNGFMDESCCPSSWWDF